MLRIACNVVSASWIRPVSESRRGTDEMELLRQYSFGVRHSEGARRLGFWLAFSAKRALEFRGRYTSRPAKISTYRTCSEKGIEADSKNPGASDGTRNGFWNGDRDTIARAA